MKKVLLAGVTGYLGSYLAKALHERGFSTRAIARNTISLLDKNTLCSEIIAVELTKPNTIEACCNQIDVIISTVGITRQKDSLTYMDVDYQANLNLLREAQKSGVRKFIYVSVLNGQKLRHLKICNAKEKFAEQLKQSGLNFALSGRMDFSLT